jgi:hypothetical protein
MPSFKQIKSNPKVHYLAELPEGGYEVELTKGLSFEALADNRVRFEDTLSQVQDSLTQAVKFSGPYED